MKISFSGWVSHINSIYVFLLCFSSLSDQITSIILKQWHIFTFESEDGMFNNIISPPVNEPLKGSCSISMLHHTTQHLEFSLLLQCSLKKKHKWIEVMQSRLAFAEKCISSSQCPLLELFISLKSPVTECCACGERGDKYKSESQKTEAHKRWQVLFTWC